MSKRDRSRRMDGRRRAAVQHQHLRIQEQQARSLRSIDNVNPRTLQPGDIVRARVTFENNDGYKTRPVVVCSTARHEITALKCTTNIQRGADLRHVVLEDLAPTGLHLPTAVNPARLIVIDRQDLLEPLGRCGPDDWAAISRELQCTKAHTSS